MKYRCYFFIDSREIGLHSFINIIDISGWSDFFTNLIGTLPRGIGMNKHSCFNYFYHILLDLVPNVSIQILCLNIPKVILYNTYIWMHFAFYFVLFCFVLFFILFCFVLFYFLFCFVLFFIFYFILFCFIFYFVLFYFLFYFVLFCFIFYFVCLFVCLFV
jgi:hypothetical protein